MRIARVVALAWLFSLSAGFLAASPARAEESADDGARATFLLLLGKYVTWPAAAFKSPTAPIVVAVVGNPRLVTELRSLSAGQQIEGRSFEIREAASAEGCSGAHIVFVSDDAQSTALASAQPLRVSEGSARHTDIAIRMQAGRVAFAVNRKDVARRGLKLSSKLMRLASSFE